MGIRSHDTGRRRQDGLTALELMITLAIGAILLTSAASSYSSFLHRKEMQAALTALQGDLVLARSHAILANRPVLLCPGKPAAGCTGSNDWSDGWIGFEDNNRDKTWQPGETLLRAGPAIRHVRISSSSHRTAILFYPGGTAPGSNATISLCGLGGPDQARKLVVSNIGRIRRDRHPDIDPSRCPEFG